jgi:hypothetical protein
MDVSLFLAVYLGAVVLFLEYASFAIASAARGRGLIDISVNHDNRYAP